MYKFYLFALLLIVLNSTKAQDIITGSVIDANDNKPLPGVQILVEGTNVGTLSGIDGSFSLEVSMTDFDLLFSFLGYETKSIKSGEISYDLPLLVELKQESLMLEEIIVFSDQARERYSPVSFSSIDAERIQFELGDRPLPEVLQRTPGLYASRDGGGSGDATISIRGFQQENIAVLLNGVPINGAENGLVYWNNWLGLTEAAASIQVQRGIGASKVALNSVGGTLNIITKTTEAQRGGSFSHSLTDYGNYRSTFSYNTGKLESGWALMLLGSRTSGQGYIDGTYVDAWAYFLGLSNQLSKDHKLVLTLLGGPERHGQRNLKLSHAEVERYGYRYNKDWGSYNGIINNASENFYHKPHLAINHFWGINNRSVLSTSVYLTPGYGGGKWNDSFNFGPGVFDFRNPSGQIDWPAIYDFNTSHDEDYVLSSGDTVSGFSRVVQTHFLASHIWAGILSSYEYEITPTFKLLTGVHYRYFKSKLRQKVDDLLGGDFYIDDYSWSLSGVAGRNEIRMPGDIIRINNGALLHTSSLYVQLEKSFGKLNVFAGGTLSDNRYRRHDVYNYPDQKWSDWVAIPAYDVKAGINFNLNRAQNIYVNAGHFNKAPYYKFVFGNFTNVPVKDRANEKVTTSELGYTFSYNRTYIKANTYYTLWQDVSFLSDELVQLENNQQTRAMVSGLNATHYGFEFDFAAQLTAKIKVGGLASIGNWKWTNDVNARLFNDNDVLVDTVKVFAKGLYVGGQPQTHFGLYTVVTILDFLNLNLEWNYFERHYASFEPSGRQNPEIRAQAFRIPSYQLVNGHLNFNIGTGPFDMDIFASVFNLFDQLYILKGEDGDGHNLENFRGFWSFGRTFNFGIKMYF